MRAEEARARISADNLIGRKISKAVLAGIVRDRMEPSQVPSEIRDDVERIARRYRAIRQRLAGAQCRNQPFYLMIKERYRDFDWKKTEKGVVIDYTYNGIKPSLLSLLLERVPVERARQPHAFDRLPAEAARTLTALWTRIGLLPVTPEQEKLFAQWIAKGLAGERLTIISPVCPDYATEPVEPDPQRPCSGPYAARRHRFTFKGLGTGIGVTAAHLFQALPDLHAVLKGELGIDLVHVVAPGDFEGFSEETRERIGISEETFLSRTAEQAHTIRSQAPVPVDTRVFTSLCGGKDGWLSRLAAMQQRLFAGDLYAVRDEPYVRETALSRRGLYDRWYGGTDHEPDFYIDIVIRQAAEYAVMGEAITHAPGLANPLVLGADDHKMGRFYTLTGDLPVLYFPRQYE